MAKKKSVKTVTSSGSLKDALATHANRTKASFVDLIVAKLIVVKNIQKLNLMLEDIDDVLKSFTLTDIEGEIGVNTVLQVDGKHNIYAGEEIKMVGEVDLKRFKADVGEQFIPASYRVEKVSYDTKQMMKDLLDGKLDSILVPYVSATNKNVTTITIRENRRASAHASLNSTTTSEGVVVNNTGNGGEGGTTGE